MELFEGGELFEAIAQGGTFTEVDCAYINAILCIEI